MFKILSNDNGGLFSVAMGSERHAPTESEIDAIMAMQDAEDVFDSHMDQAVRTTFKDDLHIRLSLSALIEAWKCVQRARAAAGY